jgi:phosphohistidine phosphatase SixA
MRGLKRLGHAPERVASSPLPRAWETAEIAARELGCRSGVERCDLLKPGVPVVKLREWVIGRGAKESVMLVGHMPGLARLVSHLLAGDDRVEVVFKKSAVCRLTRSINRRGAPYRLDWLLQPRQLRAIRADTRRG